VNLFTTTLHMYTGQRLRPLNEFVISSKHLRYLPIPMKPSSKMDSPVQPASHPLLQETHQETWA